MARGLYPHELNDPDIQWLLNTFFETDQSCFMVTEPSLPITLVRTETANTVNPMSEERIQDFFAHVGDVDALDFLKRKPNE